jgi:quercetin dioxygenase-like cupin family protein
LTFIHEPHRGSQTAGFSILAGGGDGLRRLLVATGRIPTAEVGDLHHHAGDEIVRVIQGTLLFRIGAEERVCGPGLAAVIPPGVVHGFMVEEEALIEVIAEQGMGSFYSVRSPDGDVRLVEVFRAGVPWERDPPPGSFNTTLDEMSEVSRTIATPIVPRKPPAD